MSQTLPEIKTTGGTRTIDQIVGRLAEETRAELIFLLGSGISKESCGKDSDIDLCLIFQDEQDLKRALEKAQRVLADRMVPIDLVGLRRCEFEQGKNLLAREVSRKGKLIYSRLPV